MTLSNRGDYVVRAAISVAKGFRSDSAVKLREVVADTEIPATYASQILGDLVHAGIASSKAGRDGGYRLTRSPDKVTLLEIIEAAEGPLRSENCALGAGPCRWDQVCPMHDTWLAATAALRDTLAMTSLEQIVEREEEISAGAYEVPKDSHRPRRK